MDERHCETFSPDSRSLNTVEAISMLTTLSSDWSINIENKLFTTYKFNDFNEALAYVLRISKIASEQNHHPDISFGWGYVKIILYSHALRGLHKNDFIMARKIDRLRKSSTQLELL
ncbi:MAG: hypothetical protein HON42_01160 [Alphaproteobacteria bacterium]|jgi:4a-hydroxytetrahydrobiopterin dehydratase|nr:hypothetical protein [Alphaproteobacteria bacterium]MBT5828168.1 hypothetical protein [Alphaproteobacteria bacterium]